MIEIKESTQKIILIAIVTGALAGVTGFIAGAILTLPNTERTKASIAAAEDKAKKRIGEELKNMNAAITSIKAKSAQELHEEREDTRVAIEIIAQNARDNYLKRKKAVKTVKAEIARLMAERDSAIAELNQMKQQYGETLSWQNETRLSLDHEEKGDYDFQEVSINIKPKFILPDDIGIGNWEYRAYNVHNNDSDDYYVAIELEIEIMTLPPIMLELEALNNENRIVGTGILVPIELKIGEKSYYRGGVIMESLSDIAIIKISKR